MRRPHETVDQGAPVDSPDLVTLAELAGEGFGYDNLCVRTRHDAVDALAAQLDGEVVIDDLGRRCVTRSTARGLFAKRAAAEARRREVQARDDAEYAEQAASNPPWAGISADLIPEGVAPALAMLTAARDAQPRRRSVLEHALSNEGAIEYHPIGQVPE